jgi:hypothetical protein
MSATADVSKYRDYFRDLGRDERVEVLAIPSSNQHTYFQRKVLYLEQVTSNLIYFFLSLVDLQTSKSSLRCGFYFLCILIILIPHLFE